MRTHLKHIHITISLFILTALLWHHNSISIKKFKHRLKAVDLNIFWKCLFAVMQTWKANCTWFCFLLIDKTTQCLLEHINRSTDHESDMNAAAETNTKT